MPIDPSIALQTRIPQAQSPLRTLGALTQMRAYQQQAEENELALEARRRALEDDNAARQALQEAGSPDGAVDRLYETGRYSAAGALSQQLYAGRKARAEELKANLENDERLLAFSAQILQGVSDQASFDSARRAIGSLWGPRTEAVLGHLGTTHDPDKVKEAIAWGTERGDHLRQQQDAIRNAHDAWDLQLRQAKDFREREEHNREAREKYRLSASQFLSTAQSQAEWDTFQRLLSEGGVPTDILAQFGNRWSPEASQRARQLGLSPAEAETARHHRVSERQREAEIGIRRERLERGLTEDGTPRRGQELTANRRSEIAEWKQRQYAALEEELGSERLNSTAAGPRKLAIENGAREMLGLPPLEQAEIAAASDPSKHADLLKVRQTYRSLTGRAAPRERMDELKAAIEKEKDGKKKLELELELLTLRDRYEQDPAKKATNAARIEAIRSRLGR